MVERSDFRSASRGLTVHCEVLAHLGLLCCFGELTPYNYVIALSLTLKILSGLSETPFKEP